jgi:hypothetical protein
MSFASLQDLVRDWGGFERLVAKLHETGTVSVEHNVVLYGKSGVPRQCDVVIRHKEGLYEHLIVVECKLWQQNVSRLHVDALATTVGDLNASRGVIMTTKGFQSGAETFAEFAGIDLFLVRELTDEEWGFSGRKFELILQMISRSVGNLRFHDASGIPAEGVAINLAKGPTRTTTPTRNADGTPGPSLEDVISRTSLEALKTFTEPTFTLNSGTNCTRYMEGEVSVAPPDGIRIMFGEQVVHVARMTFTLGIKYVQWPYTYDRGKDYVFALALEDCVRNSVIASARRVDSDRAQLTPLSPGPGATPRERFVNGSVAKILLDEWFPFEELAGLQSVPWPPASENAKTEETSREE